MQLLDCLFDIIIGHTHIFSVRGIPGDVIFKQTQTPYDVPGNWPSVERGVWLSKLASYAGGTVHGSPEKCYDSHIISKTDDEVFERVAKMIWFQTLSNQFHWLPRNGLKCWKSAVVSHYLKTCSSIAFKPFVYPHRMFTEIIPFRAT